MNSANAINAIITRGMIAELTELQNKINRVTKLGRSVSDFIDVVVEEFNYLLDEYIEEE